MRNKCFALIVILNFVFSFIYLIISHGSLPLYKCFPYIIFYSLGVFGLYPYETYKTLCITQGKSFILLIGSTIGVIIRLLICLLFINTSFVLLVFGIANFIDFYSRSIVYKIVLYKLNKENKLKIERNCLPHIIIDLYDCKNKDEFIEKVDKIVQNINSFNIEFKNLNNFDNETLYIESYNKNNLMIFKSLFDEKLKSYRLEKRLKREYRPHVTLCTNDDLSYAYKIAREKFSIKFAILCKILYNIK